MKKIIFIHKIMNLHVFYIFFKCTPKIIKKFIVNKSVKIKKKINLIVKINFLNGRNYFNCK
jgi:hypothetical protein